MKPIIMLTSALFLLSQNMANVLAATRTLTLSIAAQDDLFGAGHSTAPSPGGGSGGILPASIFSTALAGGTVRLISVSGTISMGIASGYEDAEGTGAFATDISSYNGISGIRADRAGFLAGVFLGPTEPADPPPATLDFTAAGLGTGFLTLSPQIGQIFFIGDGLTGTGSGSIQQFIAPVDATTLCLGFVDGNNFTGLPGYYEDNTGQLTGTFQIQSVPEPAILSFMCLSALITLKRLSRH